MNDDSDVSEYIDHSDHEPNARKARSKATGAGKSRPKHGGITRESSRVPSAEYANLVNQDDTANDVTSKVEINTLRSYRDLLNSNIAEVLQPAETSELEPLPPSQIGMSFWTSNEKHRFFAAIQLYGPGDFQALATAVGTKAKPEIKAYVLLLQEGIRELDIKATQQFGPADVPAAVETEPELLEAEETLAAALEEKARAVEVAREKQSWGEDAWLIDEDAATAFEKCYVGPDASNTKRADAEEDQNEADRTSSEDGQLNSRSPSSIELLDASTFLQLSRSLFMNSNNPEMNWHTLSQAEESDQRPSIRRTAFDDFHSLVVSLTRRLMQASLFQALSRLRASSDPRLLPYVNGFDVVAARETMGLKTQQPEYWVEAVKRCGVEVYSDSKKWKTQEGRQGTKNGVRLTENELRAELGAVLPDTGALVEDESDVEEDIDSSDSDAYTIASSSENSEDELSNAEVTLDARGRISKDRRRPLSPASYNRAERKYLERIDRHNAQDPDEEYRHILGLPATAHKHTSKPGFLYKQAEAEPGPAGWRSMVLYEAPWEQPQGMPQKRDFDAMGMEGTRKRKRRCLRADQSEPGERNVSLHDADTMDEPEVVARGSTSPRESGSNEEDDEDESKSDASQERKPGSGSEDG
jgi:RNA polymerase I-specific transcription initiation factor RRN5